MQRPTAFVLAARLEGERTWRHRRSWIGASTPKAAGDIFGETALIDNKPRMARARAAEPTNVIIVIVVTEASFEEKLRKAEPFIRGLPNIFVRNIRELAEQAIVREILHID